eukprot:Hpha_TRINITY_DN30954_c0_g1::TRINITY_DN30954_c0_g1_i1::g.112237::m.112237/K00889/PIP5K; 1-phosphatidylinositol-4-phosphate 5-kinase
MLSRHAALLTLVLPLGAAEDAAPDDQASSADDAIVIDPDFAREAYSWYAVAAATTILCCAIVLISFCRAPPRAKAPPAGLLIYRTLCDVGYAVGLIFPALMGDRELKEDWVCTWQAIIMNYFLSASFGWWLCVSVDLLTAVRNPFTDHSANLPIYHWVVWIMSICGTILAHSTGSTGRTKFGICWVQESNAWAVPLFWGPLLGGYIFGIAMLVWVRSVSHPIHKSVAVRQGEFYVAGEIFYWCFLFAISVGTVSEEASRSLMAQMTACVICRGLTDLVLWRLTVWVIKSQIAKRAAALRATDEGIEMTHTTRQNSEEMDSAFLQKKAGGLGNASVAISSVIPSDPEAERAAALKTALRREVMAACQQGIEEMARLSAQEVLEREARDGRLDLNEGDFEMQREQEMRRADDGRPFTFVDFAPLVFHSLRLANGVDTAVYRAIFTSFDDEGMIEKFSDGGRSGSFFYFTADREYIVKTVTREERRVLLGMLDDYLTHLVQNPDSLIVRFYGLHGLRMYRGARQFDFVVMENILLTRRRIDRVYDIKGSWVDRGGGVMPSDQLDVPSSPTQRVFAYFTQHEQDKHGKSGKVLKDLDLKEKIVLGPETRGQVLEQVRRDCEFFAKHGIMDYSLLVGCHRAEYDQLRKAQPELAIDLKARSAAPVQQEVSAVMHADGLSGYLPPRLERKLNDFASRLPGDPVTMNELRSNQSLAAVPLNNKSIVVPPNTSIISSPHWTGLSSGLSSQIGPPRRRGHTRNSDGAGREEGSGFAGIPRSGEASPEEVVEVMSEEVVRVVVTDETEGAFAPRQRLYQRDEGGLHSACKSREQYSGDAMYFLGVIDILQLWDRKKRCERFMKTNVLKKDSAGISCVEPETYSQRFQQRCAEIFI